MGRQRKENKKGREREEREGNKTERGRCAPSKTEFWLLKVKGP